MACPIDCAALIAEVCALLDTCCGNVLPPAVAQTIQAKLLLCIASSSGGGGGGVDCTTPSFSRSCVDVSSNATVVRATATGAASTAAGLRGVSFVNVGAANGTVGGTPIVPGEVVNFSGYFDELNHKMIYLPAIAYDGTGTTLHIATIV